MDARRAPARARPHAPVVPARAAGPRSRASSSTRTRRATRPARPRRRSRPPRARIFRRSRRWWTSGAAGCSPDRARTITPTADAAKQLGFPNIVVQGMMTTCFVHQLMQDHFGRGWVIGGKASLKLTNVLWVDERVFVRGKIRDEQAEGIADARRTATSGWRRATEPASSSAKRARSPRQGGVLAKLRAALRAQRLDGPRDRGRVLGRRRLGGADARAPRTGRARLDRARPPRFARGGRRRGRGVRGGAGEAARPAVHPPPGRSAGADRGGRFESRASDPAGSGAASARRRPARRRRRARRGSRRARAQRATTRPRPCCSGSCAGPARRASEASRSARRTASSCARCSASDAREIVAHAARRGIEWREDPSNADRRYARARLRHEWLPGLARDFNPRLLRAIGDLAEAQRRESEWISLRVEQEASRRFARDASGALRIEADAWSADALPDALARRLARLALHQMGGGRDVSRAHVERVVRFWREGRPGRRLELPGGLVLARDARRLFTRSQLAPAYRLLSSITRLQFLPASHDLQSVPDLVLVVPWGAPEEVGVNAAVLQEHGPLGRDPAHDPAAGHDAPAEPGRADRDAVQRVPRASSRPARSRRSRSRRATSKAGSARASPSPPTRPRSTDKLLETLAAKNVEDHGAAEARVVGLAADADQVVPVPAADRPLGLLHAPDAVGRRQGDELRQVARAAAHREPAARHLRRRRRRRRVEGRAGGDHRVPARARRSSPGSAAGSRRACCSSVRPAPARRCSPGPSPARRACRSSRSRAPTSSRCSSASAPRACATSSCRARRTRRASSSSTRSTPSAVTAAPASAAATTSASRR